MAQHSGGWPLIGHQTVSEYLRRCLQRGRVSHAYLFRGPQAVGKRTLAEWFAAGLLCETARSADAPCRECRSCRQWAAGVHPDFHLIEPAHTSGSFSGRLGISLEQVQELQGHLSRRPVVTGRRVAIVGDAQHLSDKAANALLKTLEEPRGSTVLLVTWDGSAGLPATLPSRCQRIELGLVADDAIVAALKARGANRSHAVAMAAHAAGCPGRALSWHEQPASFAEYQEGVAAFATLLQQPLSRRLLAVAELHQQAAAAETGAATFLLGRLHHWMMAARDRMLDAAGAHHLCQFNQSGSPQPIGSPQAWQRCLDALAEARAAMLGNANLRLSLEVLMLSLPLQSRTA